MTARRRLLVACSDTTHRARRVGASRDASGHRARRTGLQDRLCNSAHSCSIGHTIASVRRTAQGPPHHDLRLHRKGQTKRSDGRAPAGAHVSARHRPRASCCVMPRNWRMRPRRLIVRQRRRPSRTSHRPSSKRGSNKRPSGKSRKPRPTRLICRRGRRPSRASSTSGSPSSSSKATPPTATRARRRRQSRADGRSARPRGKGFFLESPPGRMQLRCPGIIDRLPAEADRPPPPGAVLTRRGAGLSGT